MSLEFTSDRLNILRVETKVMDHVYDGLTFGHRSRNVRNPSTITEDICHWRGLGGDLPLTIYGPNRTK